MATTSIGASTGISGDAIPSTTNQIPQSGAQGETPNPPKPFYDFDVVMTCNGCSGAIDRVLKKNIVEPNQYEVSLERQNVKVWGPSLPPFSTVEEKIKKTGKTIKSSRTVE
ncbi:hypothetical protein FFLO_02996 [Filobasidium floriforme]|uniref:HMA domain-containing protein n=1 Tax=Filobasidium floriforme TaxID=5210 RepID=A0A8K0JM74_9TREE|nr:uncharacterized protein HD553DRAFT_351071 [Filobasidium floriforme]KAG7553564.1 hypothetical protein FFLO_02996 [Filobasidium floriforme]KAH8082740.1 hypothetical protein HD553DRAFT_351071 [Filobasidium floriforme]